MLAEIKANALDKTRLLLINEMYIQIIRRTSDMTLRQLIPSVSD